MRAMKIRWKKGNEKEMAVDYIIPESRARGAILLLDGIPAMRSSHLLLGRLARYGYVVLYPKYRGTWESEGRFLAESPSLSVDRLLSALSRGTFFPEHHIPKKNIIIVASSFGGSVALALKNIRLVRHVYCLSPVIDYTAVRGIETLEGYLRQYYPMGYRFSHSQWRKLLQNKILKPNVKGIRQTKEKWTFFIGSRDTQIDARALQDFSTTVGCPSVVLRAGHLSLRAVLKLQIKRILLNRNAQ